MRDALLDCLDEWAGAGPNTKVDTMFRAFCKRLYENEHVDRNPLDRVARPRRVHPDEMPLRATPAPHVRLLFDACQTWQELLCLATLSHVGSRRGTVSKVRWRDVDLDQGLVTLLEKGGKTMTKPMPATYRAMLRAAAGAGGLDSAAGAYVIPNGAAAAAAGWAGRPDCLAHHQATCRAGRRRGVPARAAARVLRSIS
jgi:integrase